MKNSKINFIIILLSIFIYILFSILWIIPNYSSLYYLIINPIVWCSFALLCNAIIRKYGRYRGKTNKTQKVIILMLVYILLYYLLGLILGFENSPYSHDVITIFKNMISFVVIIIFQEYVRSKLINGSNSKLSFVLVTLLFIIVNIDFSILIFNFKTASDAFKYTASTILPIIFSSVTSTYLCKAGSFKLSLWYILPMKIIYVVSPIFPTLNWFTMGFTGILLPIIIFLFINYDHQKFENGLTRKEQKKENPFLLLPFIFAACLLVSFVLGLFKYEPMAIVSNSMSPTFNRGDVIVFSKINEKELENIDLYTIIVYRLDDIYVSHRVIRIETNINGKKLFVTKGDNNVTADNQKVSEEQVIGIVKFTIPVIGYPSVWLNDIFNTEQSVAVET